MAIDDEQWVDADTGRLLQAAPVPALVVDDRLGTGALCDRAALYGVLAEIEALGLELLEVRRLPPA